MSSIYLKKNLEWLINENGRSMSLLASKANMKKSTLHGYLNGVLPRALPGLMELAKALHVAPQDLLFKDLQEEPISSPPKNIEGRYELVLRRIESEE